MRLMWRWACCYPTVTFIRHLLNLYFIKDKDFDIINAFYTGVTDGLIIETSIFTYNYDEDTDTYYDRFSVRMFGIYEVYDLEGPQEKLYKQIKKIMIDKYMPVIYQYFFNERLTLPFSEYDSSDPNQLKLFDI